MLPMYQSIFLLILIMFQDKIIIYIKSMFTESDLLSLTFNYVFKYTFFKKKNKVI